MSKKCTPLWREHFEAKMLKTLHVRTTFGRSDVVSRGRCKGFCTLSKLSKKWGFCSMSKNDGRHRTCEEDLQRADRLVSISFVILPIYISKVLRLPRQIDARSYEVLHLSCKIIFPKLKIWRSKMQPLSGNQRPDLLTVLMNMSLVLRLPRSCSVLQCKCVVWCSCTCNCSCGSNRCRSCWCNWCSVV